MTTPTMQIKQDLDRKLEQIRNHPDYSPEAKHRYIAEAFEEAQTEYRAAIETQEREIQEHVGKAERAVFEHRYPYATSDVEKAQLRAARRGAYDGVYGAVASAEDPARGEEELARLLEGAPSALGTRSSLAPSTTSPRRRVSGKLPTHTLRGGQRSEGAGRATSRRGQKPKARNASWDTRWVSA
jgi:hypothetical protein